jgi:hypothetical protein
MYEIARVRHASDDGLHPCRYRNLGAYQYSRPNLEAIFCRPRGALHVAYSPCFEAYQDRHSQSYCVAEAINEQMYVLP